MRLALVPEALKEGETEAKRLSSGGSSLVERWVRWVQISCTLPGKTRPDYSPAKVNPDNMIQIMSGQKPS